MTTLQQLQSLDLNEVLELEALPEDERNAFLQEISTYVLEKAFLRYANQTDHKQLRMVKDLLQRQGTPEEQLALVFSEYPDLAEAVRSEVLLFRAEVESLFGRSK